MKAIAIRLEAMALRVKAIAIRMEAMALRVEAIPKNNACFRIYALVHNV